MKKLLLFSFLPALLFILSAKDVQAQLVSVSPTFPTVDQEITLTFDVKQSNDSRADALLGLTDDVYLWSGAGPTSDPFQFGPPFQQNFNEAYPEAEMTFQGNDIWTITFVPRDFYNIPQGAEINRLGLLLKNGNGSAQTEDVFVDIDAGTFIAIEVPDGDVVFEALGNNIEFAARASEPGDLELQIDEGAGFQTVATANSSIDISFDYLLNTTGSKTITVKAIAVLPSETVESEREFTIYTISDPVEEARPAGIVDGINYDADDTKVTLSLLAPNKRFVYLVGDFNNWEISDSYLMKKDGEHWWLEVTGLTPGQPYGFQYIVNIDDITSEVVAVGDPYGDLCLDPRSDQFIPEEVYPNMPAANQPNFNYSTVFQTAQVPYDWGAEEANWSRPPEEDLVIYELLVRDFVGSQYYQDVIDSLDYLQGLGINAIELMPIMEFGGNDNWGYQPNYFFAPDKAYGTKDDLKDLIKECHSRGIAVILDMVLNHADEHPYVFMYFDFSTGNPRPDNPWFNETAPHPFSVFRDFNHETQYTEDLVDTVNLYWLREYHFDGYRFDLTKGFTQNVGGSMSDNREYDQSRVDILTRMANVIWAEDPDAYVMLEHFAEASEENALGALGMYMWGGSKFRYQDIMKAKPASSDISDAANPIKVSYMESHDEQRLVYEAITDGAASGDYNIQDLSVALERHKMSSAFFFTLPGPKMMWQFGELGYDIDINFGGRTGRKPMPWGPGGLGYYEDPERQKLYGVYSAIINLTHDYQDVFDNGTMDFTLGSDVRRIGIEHPTMDVVILGNFSTTERTFDPNFTQATTWYDYFSGDPVEITDTNADLTYYPGEFHIYTTLELPTPPGDLVNSPDPPSVAAIADQQTDKNTPTDPITVTIIPGGEPVENVTLSGSSSSPVVANSDIVFTGTGAERTMVITPRLNLTGTTTITVTASDGTFSGSTSFDLEVLDVVTGLEDDLLASKVSIFPNPNQGMITLEAAGGYNGNLTLKLYDLAGKLYQSQELFLSPGRNGLMDISIQSRGVYALEVTDDNGNRFVERIIKQ